MRYTIVLIGTLLSLLTGCATLPDDFEQTYSESWPRPTETLLGAIVEEAAPEQPGLSGVELLVQPDEAFQTRFAIASLAQKSLDLQYYLWKGDLAGQLLIWRALQAADRGVRVRFLIDDIYHSGSDEIYALLDSHPNFEVRIFNPMASRGVGRYLNYAVYRKYLNHRMHNKIFLGDNAVAVMGGRNIGNDYFGIDTKANFLDLDVLAAGPAAREAGAAFDEYWNSRFAVPIRVLHDAPFTPEDLSEARSRLDGAVAKIGELPYTIDLDSEDLEERLREWSSQLSWVEAHVVVDPLERFEGQGRSAIVEFGEQHVSSIEREFIAESAYLIPSQEGLENMKQMVDRGVRVRLLTNSLQSNNHISAHSGYLKYRKDILETGAELYELRADAALRSGFRAHEEDDSIPAGIHTKSFIIDEDQALIGSFNFDPRSRDLNSEIGLVVDDADFAAEVMAAMEEDFSPENSYRLYLDEKGKLRWELQNPDGTVTVYKRDPGAPWWRRATARFLSWLPIEQDL